MDDERFVVEIAEWSPDFATERIYVERETEYAQRKADTAPRWLWFSYPALGILRRKDWQRYERALAHYGRELDHHEHEIGGGLVPIRMNVTNNSSETLRQIKIRVSVEDGGFVESRHAPQRPNRIDGAPDYLPDRPHFAMPHGFSRRGIHIKRGSVEAEFSRLTAGGEALVVNRTLYLHTTKRTRLVFAITPANGKTWHDELRAE